MDFAKLKQDFERDGFVVIPNFVTDEQILELKNRAYELVEQFDVESHKVIFSTYNQEHNTNEYFLKSAENISFFFEEGAFDSEGNLIKPKQLSINKFGHTTHDKDKVFFEFSHSPKIKSVVENIIGYSNPLIIQSMYIYKQPKIGGEVRSHQDSWFIHTDPLSCVGMWFAFEDADINNGCLYAIPGSHLQEKCKRRFILSNGVAKYDNPPVSGEYDDNQFIPVEVPKGTLVVLHGSLVHKSYPNYSDISRQAYTLHLIDGNTRYSPDNWLQRSEENPFVGF